MTNILLIYKTAFLSIRQYWKLVVFLYAITFILAFLIARPFYSTLLSEANGSIELDRLVKSFDYTAFSDFIRLHGNALKPFLSLALLLYWVHLVLSNLFLGGIFNLFQTKEKNFSLGNLITNGMPTFGKYLLIVLFETLLLICVLFASGMFFFIFSLIAEGGSEREFILWLIPPILLLLVSLTVALVSCDFSKIYLYHNPQKNAWQAFLAGIGYVFGKLRSVQFYWFFALLILLLSLVYIGLNSAIGMVSGFTIYVMFLIQQAYILGRNGLRVGYWAMIFQFYHYNPIIPKTKSVNSENTTLEEEH